MSDPRPAFQVNLGRLGQWLSGGSAAGPVAERDSAGLPYSQPDIINTLRTNYETAAQHGGAEATEACFNFAWALVHSRSPADVRVGLELLEALLAAEGANRRELLFLTAVGQFRQRRALEARRTLQAALVEFPDFRQADALLDACEAEVVHDGLVGVGAGAAILGVVAAVAVAALKKR